MASEDEYSPVSESESGPEWMEEESEPESEEALEAPGSYPMPPPPPRARDASSESGRSTASVSSRRGGVRKKRRRKFAGESSGEPENDYDAYQLLLEKERCNIANLGRGRVAVYNDDTSDMFGFGKWKIEDGALDRLCARNADVLGDMYGKQNSGVKRLLDKCKVYDEKPSMWHLNFDAQLAVGELPLFDGILNTVTDKFTPYSSDKMCTTKMLMTSEEFRTASTEADIAEVRRILRQMFPEEALYNNALSRLALALLSHRNFHREILILYGDGSNGKTVLVKLLRLVFDELVTTLSMNNLKETTDSAGDKPMSWPQYMQGKRLVIFDEMNGNIDCALMKRMRGDDVFESRQQHSAKQDTQTITATLLLTGNEPPQCPKADKALSDSMIAYHMPAKGVHGTPDPDPKKLQFRIDPDIIDKFKCTGMKVAMVRELSEHLRGYLQRGHKHPNEPSEFDFTGYLLNEENKTLEDHVWAVVTKEGATPQNMIKNSDLYNAVCANGYPQSKTKFTRDTLFLRTDPQIGVVSHARQNVYRSLKWVNAAPETSNGMFAQFG